MENWSIGLCFSMHCHSSFLKCWTDWFQVKNSLLDCLTLLFFLYRRDQNYPNRFVRIIMLVHIGSTVDLHRLCKTDCFTMVFPQATGESPVPEASLPASSSMTLVSAGWSLPHVLKPPFIFICYTYFPIFLNALSQRCYHGH